MLMSMHLAFDLSQLLSSVVSLRLFVLLVRVAQDGCRLTAFAVELRALVQKAVKTRRRALEGARNAVETRRLA